MCCFLGIMVVNPMGIVALMNIALPQLMLFGVNAGLNWQMDLCVPETMNASIKFALGVYVPLAFLMPIAPRDNFVQTNICHL